MAESWWRHRDSNPGHPACKAGALPTELYPPSFERRELRDKKLNRALRAFRQAQVKGFECFESDRSLLALVTPGKPETRESTFRRDTKSVCEFLRRKEVIQPQVPLRLPCYDFIPVTSYTLGPCLLAVGSGTSGATGFHDVTGGVYKTRERIHAAVADAALLAIPASWRRVAASNPN